MAFPANTLRWTFWTSWIQSLQSLQLGENEDVQYSFAEKFDASRKFKTHLHWCHAIVQPTLILKGVFQHLPACPCWNTTPVVQVLHLTLLPGRWHCRDSGKHVQDPWSRSLESDAGNLPRSIDQSQNQSIPKHHRLIIDILGISMAFVYWWFNFSVIMTAASGTLAVIHIQPFGEDLHCERIPCSWQISRRRFLGLCHQAGISYD
jgi:hypothetical protein